MSIWWSLDSLDLRSHAKIQTKLSQKKKKNSLKIDVDNCYMYVPSNFIEIVEI